MIRFRKPEGPVLLRIASLLAVRAAAIAAALYGIVAADAQFTAPPLSQRYAAVTDSRVAAPSTVAARVDGDTIQFSDVADVAMRRSGPAILDQLIGNVLIDQEARKENISVSLADIDARMEDVRAMMKPRVLEEELMQHHMSIEDMRKDLRVEIEVERLTSHLLPPVKMRHVREILVRVRPKGIAPGQGDYMHTAAEAKAIVAAIQRGLKAGIPFEDLARRYSDDAANKQSSGDIGVVTDIPDSASDFSARMLCAQPAVFHALFALKPGEVTRSPIATSFGYHFLKVVSSAEQQGSSDRDLYAVAASRAREGQFKAYAPKVVQSLREKSDIETYLGSYAVGPAGVAASVNGENITVSQVLDMAMQYVGPPVLDDMITDVLVEHEARKQNIVVAPTEIDAALDEIRNRMKPKTLADFLTQNHQTMSEFRKSQMYRLLAGKLVVKSLGPQTMVHAKHILILTRGASASRVSGARPHTEAEARAIVAKVQRGLRSGKKFEDLAREYSEDTGTRKSGGDLGIIERMNPFGTDIFVAAQTLKAGEVTSKPVRSDLGLHLIKAQSTNANHPPAEDRSYATREKALQEVEIQMFLHGYLKSLRAKHDVVNYLSSGGVKGVSISEGPLRR